MIRLRSYVDSLQIRHARGRLGFKKKDVIFVIDTNKSYEKTLMLISFKITRNPSLHSVKNELVRVSNQGFKRVFIMIELSMVNESKSKYPVAFDRNNG